MVRFRNSALAALTLVIGAVSSPVLAVGSASSALQAMRELNVIVLRNLTHQGGGEIEGKTFVGGDFTGQKTQIAFGASNGQGTTASAWASLTIGGNFSAGADITDGVGGTNYGAYIVGNSANLIELKNVGGTINVGGSANTVKMTTGSVLNVVGQVTQNLDLSDRNVINVGSVNQIQGGQNTTINVRGNVQNFLGLGANAQVNVSGNVGQVNGSSGVRVSIGGNVQNTLTVGDSGAALVGGSVNQVNVGNNASLKVVGTSGEVSLGSNSSAQLGNTANKVNLGTGSSASVRGNVQNGGNIGSGTLTVLGNASSVDIGNGGTVYAGGSITGNNNGGTRNANYTFGSNPPAPVTPAAPTGPTAPVVGSIAAQIAQITDDLAALSNSLASLAIVNNQSTITVQGTKLTFNAVNSGAGYALFNLSSVQAAAATEFAYNFGGFTGPVIINVTRPAGVSNVVTAANFVGDARANNRQVIWNFGDASSVVLGRQHQGSVLAYAADLRSNVIEGSVVARNLTQTNEIHLGTYGGGDSFLIGSIPEPSQWALFIAGFGLVGSMIRRRRRGFAVAA